MESQVSLLQTGRTTLTRRCPQLKLIKFFFLAKHSYMAPTGW